MPEPKPASTGTEVGANEGELRFWQAGERMRLAELALAGQTANLAAMETRAQAMLAWSSASMVGLVAIVLQTHALLPAFAGGALLLLAATSCAAALWPRAWHQPGYSSAEFDAIAYPTQLESLEAMAGGYQCAWATNDTRLRLFMRLMTFAWICFLAAGPAALAAALVRG